MFRLCRLRKSFSSINAQRYYLKNKNLTTAAVNVIRETENYKEGDQIHGYTVKQVSEIPEFHATGIFLQHDNTGAEHLHVARDDQNNVFSVAFRTTPMDSTGVSHILEHTVLCGSQKYPCRDPFFKMLNRSLSTFMNAFTASDWTMYPFSTQNERDYYNLMSVYLDAVFFPLLNELDFSQEGWRLEQSDLQDPSSDIIFKGVVFNEMKGALSNSESLYATHHQCLLLPHHTYGYISGGDPLCIPQLTHKQLKEFHTSHYHPSNARFYTYGNFSLENHLKTINESIMKKFEKINPNTDIPVEPKWNEPKQVEINCPPDPLAPDPDKQTTVSVSYLLDYIDDPFEAFTLGILSSLLVDGPNSPFYQALIEPNIGSDYSPVIGVDSHTKNPSFAVGLQGIHSNDVDNVVNIIKETFQKVVREGFDPTRIESILHRIELAMKHQTTNFGLNMIVAVIYSWNQDKNPLDSFTLNEQVKRFRETMEKEPSYLQKKVEELFLSNTHELTLIMKPKTDYSEEKDIKENEILQEKISQLSDEDKSSIFEKALQLEQQQSEKEDISFLPKMHVTDIDKNIKVTDFEKHFIDNVEVYKMTQPTNGITYFRAITTTSSIPYTIRPYLPLFCQVLTKLGAGSMNYKELAQRIELNTGGLGVSTHLTTHHTDDDCFEQGIMLSSHSLERNIPMMFSLWQDVLNSPTLYNPDRLQTLINACANDLAMSVAHSGHLYAMSSAAKNLTPAAQISELFGGMSQVNFMKRVAEKENLDDVIENLMKLVTYMLNVNEMRCSLNTTDELMEQSLHGLEGLISSLNVVGYDDHDIIEDNDFKPKYQKTFIEMEFPVNYISRCIRTVPYTHEDTAKLQILAKLLSAKYLHREIREKGGAYGSGAKIGGGIFSFYSYRDPNTTKTLDAFSNSVRWACDGNFSNEDIDEAKLSVFSAVDSPVAPSGQGMSLFRNGLTDEMRQNHRNRLFAVGKEELVDVAHRYLISNDQAEAIIGPKNDLFLNDNNWIKPRKIEL